MGTHRYLRALGAFALAAFSAGGCSATERPDAAAPDPSPGEPTAATEIDAVTFAGWTSAGIEPTALAGDEEFLRRASLDIIGRVPTAEETRAFVASTDPDKRSALVDRLLASDEYAQYWADIYLDLLIGMDPQTRRRFGDDVHDWLAGGLAEGRGWDQTVDAMITATGELPDNPAAGFIVARMREGKVENLVGRTGDIFLGVQIQCAQCHDHPYADFSREDFWGMGAHYARSRVRIDRSSQPPIPRVVDTRRGEMRIEMEGTDRKKKIDPSFLGRAVTIDDEETRREALSREIRESDLFARAAVGHTWSQLFGRGIVEPWNDLGLDPESHPALLETVADEFVDLGYDHRELLRATVLSQAYQRSSAGPVERRAQAEAVFARAPVRPLSPHQLFRSLFSVTGIEDVENPKVRRRVRKAKREAQKQYLFVFGDDEMAQRDAFSGNVPQALLLLNGDLTNQGVVARPGTTLGRILDASDDDGERIENLYLAVYGRKPSADEVERGVAFVRGHESRQAYEDLMFAMLYSSEFLSNH